MGIKGGRSLRGTEEEGYVKHNVSIPPSVDERLTKYMRDEERPRSWCVQRALDEWLKKKGY